jgi:hypothetical protein
MRRTSPVLVIVACVFSAPSLLAQQHQHPSGQERLGTLHFQTSCAPRVAATFDRGVALLHSFEFGASIKNLRFFSANGCFCK